MKESDWKFWKNLEYLQKTFSAKNPKEKFCDLFFQNQITCVKATLKFLKLNYYEISAFQTINLILINKKKFIRVLLPGNAPDWMTEWMIYLFKLTVLVRVSVVNYGFCCCFVLID